MLLWLLLKRKGAGPSGGGKVATTAEVLALSWFYNFHYLRIKLQINLLKIFARSV